MTETEKSENDKGPVVEVENLKTNDVEKFHVAWSTTVAEVWSKAYEVFGEGRGDGDQFQCADGTSLTPHLDKTLQQLREEKLCSARKFQIRGPTGGASSLARRRA